MWYVIHAGNFVYIIGTLIIVLTRSYNAQISNPISTDSYNKNNNIRKSINDNDDLRVKRDVIKGPSFIPIIDESSAASDLKYENDEVSTEGGWRRISIGKPENNQ